MATKSERKWNGQDSPNKVYLAEPCKVCGTRQRYVTTDKCRECSTNKNVLQSVVDAERSRIPGRRRMDNVMMDRKLAKELRRLDL